MVRSAYVFTNTPMAILFCELVSLLGFSRITMETTSFPATGFPISQSSFLLLSTGVHDRSLSWNRKRTSSARWTVLQSVVWCLWIYI